MKKETTEEKIKRVAMELIMKHGVSGTNIREITKEAGVNVALINYYFRSKQNLFNIIMQENIDNFLRKLHAILNDSTSTIELKLRTLISEYIDLLIKQPDIPLYILNELKTNQDQFVSHIKEHLNIPSTPFFSQIMEKNVSNENPFHIIMNMISMIIFPFLAFPVFEGVGHLKHEQFLMMMEERKRLIPQWIISMLLTNPNSKEDL